MAIKDYQSLLSKYNMLVIQAQDMAQRRQNEKEEWAEKEAKYNQIEKKAKEFCENILRHNNKKKEAKEEPSYPSDLYNLLEEAEKSYKEGLNNNATTLRKVVKRNGEIRNKLKEKEKENKELKEEAESLNKKYKNEVIAKAQSEEEKAQLEKDFLARREKERKQKEQNEIIQKTMDTFALDKKTKGVLKSIKEGKAPSNLDIAYLNEDEKDAVTIMEESTDPVTESEKNLHRVNSRQKPVKKKKMTSKSIPVEKNPVKKDTTPTLYPENIKTNMERINSIKGGWEFIEAIGVAGLSLYTDIEAYVMQKANVTKSSARIALSALDTAGVINARNESVPVLPRFQLITLAEKGILIFKEKYNKTPVKSLYEKLIAEHTSVKHGFGIYLLSEKLKKLPYYDSVDIEHRKLKKILPDGTGYIPDIVIKSGDQKPLYIEYERLTQSENEFFKKCRGMREVAETIDFVVENQKELFDICERIRLWTQKERLEYRFKGTKPLKIRVTTAVNACQKNTNLFEDKCWFIFFENSKDGLIETYGLTSQNKS